MSPADLFKCSRAGAASAPAERVPRPLHHSHVIRPRFRPLLLVGLMLVTYILTYFVLGPALPQVLFAFVALPLLWTLVGAVSIACWRSLPIDRPRAAGRALLLVAVVAGAQIAVTAIAGLFLGFGLSPYTHQFPVLLGYLVYVAALLIGTEVSRAYLVTLAGGRWPGLAIAGCALFFSAFSISPTAYHLLARPTETLPIVGQRILPALSENLAATYLAAMGGAGASLTYLGVLRAFEWLSPILPSFSWLPSAFVGTLCPALALIAFQHVFAPASEQEEGRTPAARDQAGGSPTAWILVAAVAVGVVWINTGLLGVQPTLVASGSMTPQFQVGDIVIVRKVSPDAIEVGDVVRYRHEGVDVIHRVVAIEDHEGGTVFVTRGDANNKVDPPVEPSALHGKVVAAIPKVGWVALGLREAIRWLGGILR